MNSKDELDPGLARQLAALEYEPKRDERKAARGRAAFLNHASELREAVSMGSKARHIFWIDTIRAKFTPRKERSPMFGTLATVLLIFSLAFGGSGLSVAAAQASRPDEPLYGLKLWSEEARLRLSVGQQAELEWTLRLVERRSNEIQNMLEEGKTPPESALARYQAQVEQVTRLAAGMPGEEALRTLARVQDRLRLLDQTTQAGGPQAEAVLARIHTMLQERIHWIDAAVEDADHLRQMQRDRDQNRDPIQLHTGTPAKQSGPGDGSCNECTPAGTPQGGNPWTDTTPTPGSGYGPGPQPTDNPGPGPQATDNPGPGPLATENPGPGPQPTDNPGPGPQATDNPGTGPGEQPTQSGAKNGKP